MSRLTTERLSTADGLTNDQSDAESSHVPVAITSALYGSSNCLNWPARQ